MGFKYRYPAFGRLDANLAWFGLSKHGGILWITPPSPKPYGQPLFSMN